MKTADMMLSVIEKFRGWVRPFFGDRSTSTKRSLDDESAGPSESKIRKISLSEEDNWRKGSFSNSREWKVNQFQINMSTPQTSNCSGYSWEHNGWESGNHEACPTMNRQRTQGRSHSCFQQANLKPGCNISAQGARPKEVEIISEHPPCTVSRHHQRSPKRPFKVLDPPSLTPVSSNRTMTSSCKHSTQHMSKDTFPSDDEIAEIPQPTPSAQSRQPEIEVLKTVTSCNGKMVNGASPARMHYRSHSSVFSTSSCSSRQHNTLSHEMQLEGKFLYSRVVDRVMELRPMIGRNPFFKQINHSGPSDIARLFEESEDRSSRSYFERDPLMPIRDAQAHRKACNGIDSALIQSEEKSFNRINVPVNRKHEQEPSTSGGRHQSAEDDCFVVAVRQAKLFPGSKPCIVPEVLADIKRKYEEKAKILKSEAEEYASFSSKISDVTAMGSLVVKKQIEHDMSEQMRNYMRISEQLSSSEEIEEIPVLPELTPEMEKEINEALRQPDEKVLVNAFSITIKGRDIRTLRGLNWLNDEVINFYMNLLIERGKNDNYPSVYAFNTFFYPKLISSGHASLKRWTRKVDVFAHDYLLVPVHLGMHWCMAIVDMQNKIIQYYDSMSGRNRQCLQALLKYLEDESLDKKKQPFNTTGWATEFAEDIPQQNNGSDCGMFSCMYAEYVSRKAPITFTQEDMPYFRRKMVYEIVKAKLLC